MDNITVLITGTGAPGIMGTLYSLRNNFDNRTIRTIGADMAEEVAGKHLCDRFYQIKGAHEPEYLSQLLSICRREGVDVLLPHNTAELLVLAKNKEAFAAVGTMVAISDKTGIEAANNKYHLLKAAKMIGVPVPEFYLVSSFSDLRRCAQKLGWPARPFVVKPPVSSGMRGLRIVDESIDLRNMFFLDKPSGIHLKMDNLREILGDSFPPILAVEFLPGEEYTVDVLTTGATTGEPVAIPRKRDLLKSGITFIGTVEKNEDLINYSGLLSRVLGLDYAHGFQYKLGEDNRPKLLESNPRVQGTMVLSTFAGANIIYGAVKRALGEELPPFNINWGTRIIRYWGGLGVSGEKVTARL